MSMAKERCPVCGAVMPTNYVRRVAHRTSKRHLAALDRAIRNSKKRKGGK